MKLLEKIQFIIEARLQKIWYTKKTNWLCYPFLPLIYLYAFLSKLNQWWQKRHIYHSTLPIIVVGNITVGGSGKTPSIIALVKLLKQQGFKPGVISRGYPISPALPILLNPNSLASEVGDEPLLIYHKTQVPTVVCKNRVNAIRCLEKLDVDIILSDDGLQNFTFTHHVEIVLFDSQLRFGNEQLIPCGPLREPMARLKTVDFVVEKRLSSDSLQENDLSIALCTKQFITLPDWKKNADTLVEPTFFQGKKVVAITGIAHPERFFASLKSLGLDFASVSFPDHYAFSAADFAQFKDCEIIMTEKDAIKCYVFADSHFWCLPLEGEFSLSFIAAFNARFALSFMK